MTTRVFHFISIKFFGMKIKKVCWEKEFELMRLFLRLLVLFWEKIFSYFRFIYHVCYLVIANYISNYVTVCKFKNDKKRADGKNKNLNKMLLARRKWKDAIHKQVLLNSLDHQHSELAQVSNNVGGFWSCCGKTSDIASDESSSATNTS
jgi:hypothetical protein